MTRIIRVESCARCPFFRSLSGYFAGWCAAVKRCDGNTLLTSKEIPDWCPLEKESEKP